MPHLDERMTIKEQSPFTALFEKLQADFQVKPGISLNSIFNPTYLNFLQFYFMPYVFIWSGYVYREMDVTRLTQGTVEKNFGTRKNLINCAMLPVRYINATMKILLANTRAQAAEEADNEALDTKPVFSSGLIVIYTFKP
jgi:hypothetical protein